MDAWQKDEDGNYVTDALGNKIEKPMGFVYNKLGFYRAFDLSDIDQSEDAKQRRAISTMYAIAAPHSLDSFADMAMFSCPTLE